MEIDCVSTLLGYTSRRYFTQARGRWVFRGHSDATYALLPSVGRYAHTSRSREKYEQSLFDTFGARHTGIWQPCRQATGNGSR